MQELTGPGANLIQGHRYRIVHRSETQRYDRYSIMSYIGPATTYQKALSFSARPVAGTQEMLISWIISIVEVPQTTPIVLNRRA